MSVSGRGISVIIPTLNRARELEECLAALRRQTLQPLEIIVVDDGSTDDTEEVARRFRVNLLRGGGGGQANACRNQGAMHASGSVLAFFDSDPVPSPAALEIAARTLAETDADAVVGLYSVHHRHPNVASQYKNLWIRYSYLKSSGHVDWIFGAVSAIRTEAFVKAGGFDRTMMMTHGGEDLELGKRMATHDLTILLNPACEVEHLKKHSVGSLLKNDFLRSDGFVQVAGKVGHLGQSVRSGFVNVYPAFAYSVPVSCSVVAAGLGTLLWGLTPVVPAVCALLYGGLNASFVSYFARHRGPVQTVQVVGLLFADHLACALGGARGFLRYLSGR